MVNEEIRNRIRIAIAAWAYEYGDSPIMSDGDYDKLSRQIDLGKKTGNDLMDKFFDDHYHPDTGMWIHEHPEKDKLEILYEKYYKDCPLRGNG